MQTTSTTSSRPIRPSARAEEHALATYEPRKRWTHDACFEPVGSDGYTNDRADDICVDIFRDLASELDEIALSEAFNGVQAPETLRLSWRMTDDGFRVIATYWGRVDVSRRWSRDVKSLREGWALLAASDIITLETWRDANALKAFAMLGR